MIRWALVLVLLVAGCTSSSKGGARTSSAPVPTPSLTPIGTSTSPRPSTSLGVVLLTPVAGGPTTTVTAASCPLVTQAFVADAIGMRLGRVTVQSSGKRVVGCRIYALQGSPLSESEHLPGPKQPVVEIVRTRYASALVASVALQRLVGENRQTTGPISCFQIAFYPPDTGKDWACAFASGATVVLVRTVVTSPALNALRVTQQVRSGL